MAFGKLKKNIYKTMVTTKCTVFYYQSMQIVNCSISLVAIGQGATKTKSAITYQEGTEYVEGDEVWECKRRATVL